MLFVAMCVPQVPFPRYSQLPATDRTSNGKPYRKTRRRVVDLHHTTLSSASYQFFAYLLYFLEIVFFFAFCLRPKPQTHQEHRILLRISFILPPAFCRSSCSHNSFSNLDPSAYLFINGNAAKILGPFSPGMCVRLE